MNLVVDIGNTRIKAALFLKTELKEVLFFESIETVEQHFTPFLPTIRQLIVSTVRGQFTGFNKALKEDIPCLIFTKDTPLPIQNNYHSKETLGLDRLAAAVAANAFAPQTAVLNIDTGTCIKYNFCTAEGIFLGGGISPGLTMRLRAMHEFTAGLPLIEYEANYTTLVGKSTKESILSGALLGAVAEVEQMIVAYKSNYPELKIIVSGGDTDFFAKRLKSSIFARPNLVLEGLNQIVEYNA